MRARRRWHDLPVLALPQLRCTGPRVSLAVKAARAVVVLGAGVAVGGAGCGSSAHPAPQLLSSEAALRVASANPVAVSPLPGTRDAPPATQISFLGTAPTTISEVHVVGSRSGAHAGALRRYSTGTGESFLPARPFLPGERVQVSARADTGGATRTARTGFTVAEPVAVSQLRFPSSGGDSQAVQHFLSAPGITPSSVTIISPAQPAATRGLLFLAPYQGQGAPGPMIVNQDGGLVWFHRLPPGVDAANFGVQRYGGKPVLAWWQGRVLQLGFGEGEDVLYDGAYRRVAAIRAGNGLQTDLHVLRLTPQGTAWIDAFEPVRANLSAVRGPANGVLNDSVIQQIDIATGLVMWEWHALGHIRAGESHTPPPPGSYPWDYVHVNSLDAGASGDVLLSARNTWALYDVDVRTGAVRWRLGGRHSSFSLGPGARFYWQHDGEFQPHGLLSMFDNGSDPPEETQSRALLLRPDSRTHSATLVRRFVNPSRTLLSGSQGNLARLAGGNWLVGYGGLPDFTEFDATGHVLLDGTLGRGVQDFTTYLARWRGSPSSPPSLAVQAAGAGEALLAASWNGATDVTGWRVLEGPRPTRLRPLTRLPARGFETTATVPVHGAYVAVQALDGAGRVLGTSAALRG
jgi:Arylsulfotransferase (ASST)